LQRKARRQNEQGLKPPSGAVLAAVPTDGGFAYGVFMKLVCGVGINDAGYIVKPVINGKQVYCQSYDVWKDMLRRCYSDTRQERQPTYIGVTVCNDWHSFSSFNSWWLVNNVDGWQLDKDLLTYSRIYSPETCIYVPQWLNKFTNNRLAARGRYPIGVSYHRRTGKYQSHCGHPFGKYEYLGLFSTPEEANAEWKLRKLEISAELKWRMDEIDARIYRRVVEIIEKAK